MLIVKGGDSSPLFSHSQILEEVETIGSRISNLVQEREKLILEMATQKSKYNREIHEYDVELAVHIITTGDSSGFTKVLPKLDLLKYTNRLREIKSIIVRLNQEIASHLTINTVLQIQNLGNDSYNMIVKHSTVSKNTYDEFINVVEYYKDAGVWYKVGHTRSDKEIISQFKIDTLNNLLNSNL